ncbi:MAG: YhjD/YihY/BrkB family envelope integrity protein [Acidimicrobiales bacterium]
MSKGPIGWVISAWRFVIDVALRWYHGRVGDLAASVTFWIVISLPALVLALLAVIGPLDRLVTGVQFQGRIESEVEEFIARVFTDESQGISDSITDLFSENNNSLAAVSLALAIWSISRGFSGLIRALEDIYEIEDRRPWYHTRVVAVILGLGSILISVPLVLMEIYVWGSITDGLVESTLRGLVAVVVLILWASIVYHYGPAERHRWRFDLPGAFVAAFLWWLLSYGFARYVDITSNANEVRAAVGAGLLALTWIWLAAQVLLIGGAVNYILGERLGVSRGRRSWTINEVVTKSTGEIRKIVVPDRDDTAPQRIVTRAPDGQTVQTSQPAEAGQPGEVTQPGQSAQTRSHPLAVERVVVESTNGQPVEAPPSNGQPTKAPSSKVLPGDRQPSNGG